MSRSFRLIALGGSFVLLTGAQSGGSCPGCPVTVREGRWQVPIRTLELTGDVLEVNLNGAGPQSSWHFGAKVKPGAGAGVRFQVAELSTEPRGPQNILRVPSAVVSYTDREISTTAQAIQVWMRAADPNKHTLVYVEAPRPLTLELRADGQLIARAVLEDSLYVTNGRLMPEKVTAGLAFLIMRAVVGAVDEQAGVRRVGPDKYLATPAELRKNLVEFVRPPQYPGRDAPAGSSVSLVITIGPDGHVKEVRAWRGDPRLVEHCRPAVLKWRFTPLKYNGSPVSVETSVFMVLDADGQILIPTMLQGA